MIAAPGLGTFDDLLLRGWGFGMEWLLVPCEAEGLFGGIGVF